VVRLDVDPGPGAGYLWAHEFTIVGGSSGYVGIEAPTDGGSGGSGKVAIFSIRDALRAVGEEAAVSAPAGAATCRVALPWDAGRSYELRVWTAQEGWWSAAVRDDVTNRETLVGRIVVPDHWRRLASLSITRTEYRGRPLQRCDELRACRIVYQEPTADGGRVQPERHESRVGPGTCEGSHVEAVPDGVRHAMGGPS
jgi:hypothetical protein